MGCLSSLLLGVFSNCCRLLQGLGKFCFPQLGTVGLKDRFSLGFPLFPGLKLLMSPCPELLQSLKNRDLKVNMYCRIPATVTGTHSLFICKSDVAMLHKEIRDAAGHGGGTKQKPVTRTVPETGCHLLIYKI